MDTILGIETSTGVCSVAVFSEDRVLAECFADQAFEHSSRLTSLIGEALEKAAVTARQLSAISVSIGPGSYTGLRVGLSTAKGMCYSLDKPLIAISTLESLAYSSYSIVGSYDVIIPMLDARRDEVYTAVFSRDYSIITPAFPLILDESSLSKLFLPYQRILLIGNGVPKVVVPAGAASVECRAVDCSATFLRRPSFSKYQAGFTEDVAYCEPLYLKPPNITRSRKTLL